MSVELASDVIALFATRIDAITSETPRAGFVRSGYRFRVIDEPASAIEGLYFVDVTGVRPHKRDYGRQENRWEADVSVRVGYFRGGGDADEGDRQSVMRNASDDMMRLADFLENTASYDGANTGARRIVFAGASRVLDAKDREVWEAKFLVEWQSDWITT